MSGSSVSGGSVSGSSVSGGSVSGGSVSGVSTSGKSGWSANGSGAVAAVTSAGSSSVSGRGASFSRREKRRRSTSRIMPKSSPGTMSVDLMLNLRYCDLRNPSGPATIMPPTALVPMMWELS